MENKFRKIFNHSECLSEETMMAYIKGALTSKEKHTVEKHLLHCEFCADVLEGLQLIENKNSIPKIVSGINEKISRKISEGGTKLIWMDTRVRLAIAAAVVVLVVSVFFLKEFIGRDGNNYLSENIHPSSKPEKVDGFINDSTKIVAQTYTQEQKSNPVADDAKRTNTDKIIALQQPNANKKFENTSGNLSSEAKPLEPIVTTETTSSDEGNLSKAEPSKVLDAQIRVQEREEAQEKIISMNKDVNVADSKSLKKSIPKNAQEKTLMQGEKNKNDKPEYAAPSSATGAATSVNTHTPTSVENMPLSLEDSIKSKYYSYSIKYPKEAKEKGIGGVVIITFDIDSTCSIINRKVKKGLGYGCDEAALAVLGKMEKDMKRDNKSVCKPFSITLPVQFKLK